MALVVVAATVLGGGYGTCRALAQHAAAVNGTAAGSVLRLCAGVNEAVAGLPARGAKAAESLSGVSVTEWQATFEDAGRALAVELAAQAVVTALLLLVRARGSPLQPVGLRALFAAVQRRSTLKLHFLRSSGAPSFSHQYSTGGIGLRAVAATLHLLAVRLKSLQCALL